MLTAHPNPRFLVPRAAYVHVPFCRHRCGYCNFTLIAGRDDLIAQYLAALNRELEQLAQPYEVDSLYFGGGTPSHLPPHELRSLLDTVRRWFPLAIGAEVSLEANPLDVTPERCRVLADCGVNRLSLGVQSWNDAKLALLERDHRGPEIQRAAELAQQHFPAWSLDLIFGSPGESLKGWREDLERSLALSPSHVSLYGLTWEKGTPFWSRREKGELAACEEGAEREMFELAIDLLTQHGWEQYEVSNFARPGYRCRHNEVYWTGRTFFGVGPGAARLVEGRREVNHRSSTTYIRRLLSGGTATAEVEQLSPIDAARERLVFGLRRLDGINAEWFRDETGYDVHELGGEALREYLEQGWLAWTEPWLRLTRAGLMISDALWPAFLV